jgi:hypothetical protein
MAVSGWMRLPVFDLYLDDTPGNEADGASQEVMLPLKAVKRQAGD